MMMDAIDAMYQQAIEEYKRLQDVLLDENSKLSKTLTQAYKMVHEFTKESKAIRSTQRRYHRYVKNDDASYLLNHAHTQTAAKQKYVKAYKLINEIRAILLGTFFGMDEENFTITYAFYAFVDGEMVRYNGSTLNAKIINSKKIRHNKSKLQEFELVLNTSASKLKELYKSVESNIIPKVYRIFQDITENPPNPPIHSPIPSRYLPEMVETYAQQVLGMDKSGIFPENTIVPTSIDPHTILELFLAAKNNVPWFGGGDVGNVQVKGDSPDLTTWQSLETGFNIILNICDQIKYDTEMPTKENLNALKQRISALYQTTAKAGQDKIMDHLKLLK